MNIRPSLAMFAGGVIVATIGYVSGSSYGAQFAVSVAPLAQAAIKDAGGGGASGTGVTAQFINRFGSPTRHPQLSGGDDLDEQTRADVAQRVAALPGVGGVSWADGTMMAEAGEEQFSTRHCQDDVEGLLRTRTIRFDGGSSVIAEPSQVLLDEVAAALRPCLGSIIAITGHTDNLGTKPGNLSLSQARAIAVRDGLIKRGIPRDGLRARGVGSSEPVEGLNEADPANRRIEFSVLATEPIVPTPVDTPGPR
jgi:OOP family OmpA-OmpF porin